MFHVRDRWTLEGAVVAVRRTVEVTGDAPGLRFVDHVCRGSRGDVERLRLFAPGALQSSDRGGAGARLCSAVPFRERRVVPRNDAGHVGKEIECADLLLREGDRDPSERGRKMRATGLAIISSLIEALPTVPLQGTGYDLATGKPWDHIWVAPWLRNATEDTRVLVRAYRRERTLGRAHPEWFHWVKTYVDWLVQQQRADEAGMLSMEAFLSLYDSTKDPKWLVRARTAADFAESWIWIWNLLMPLDADDAKLSWKKGVPTIGIQGITALHAGSADEYLDWAVPSYAKLYRLTGDRHYLDVARILLHGTKSMVALPGRRYDMKGVGWQQEGWRMRPGGAGRGTSGHRFWLPWISGNHLAGIMGLEDDDPELFKQLSQPAPTN